MALSDAQPRDIQFRSTTKSIRILNLPDIDNLHPRQPPKVTSRCGTFTPRNGCPFWTMVSEFLFFSRWRKPVAHNTTSLLRARNSTHKPSTTYDQYPAPMQQKQEGMLCGIGDSHIYRTILDFDSFKILNSQKKKEMAMD